jgi:hypothetical protein
MQHFGERGEPRHDLDRKNQTHHNTNPADIAWGQQLDQARKDGKYPPKKK